MPSLAEMRAELKELRKADPAHGPISRMKKSDVSAALEKLRVAREETPAPAATPSAAPRRAHPATESLKAAKASEFPVEPAHHSEAPAGTKKGAPRKTARKAFEGETPKKVVAAEKGASKKQLMALLAKMMAEE